MQVVFLAKKPIITMAKTVRKYSLIMKGLQAVNFSKIWYFYKNLICLGLFGICLFGKIKYTKRLEKVF